jgi:anti-sigma B factor antagonist
MAIRRLVTIEQLPEITSEDQGRRFLGKIQDRMSDKRPGLVLDCSALSQMDKPVLHLLLSCLEEAMKRNGDARLAAVSPSAQAMLKLIGADRLFQIFASSDRRGKQLSSALRRLGRDRVFTRRGRSGF